MSPTEEDGRIEPRPVHRRSKIELPPPERPLNDPPAMPASFAPTPAPGGSPPPALASAQRASAEWLAALRAGEAPSERRPRGAVNPLLLREMQARFRGPRPFYWITAYLTFTAGLAWSVYRRGLGDAPLPGIEAPAAPGPSVIGAMLLAQLIAFLLLAPGLTAGAISGEIEGRSYELLLATPLSGWQILRGKLGAAMAFLLLLSLCALPVAALAFVLGGPGALDILRGQLTLLTAGLLLSSLGLAASAIAGRSDRAIVLAYLASFALCFGPPIGLWWIAGMDLPGWLRAPLAGGLAALTPLLSSLAAEQEGIRGALFGSRVEAGLAGRSFLAQALAIQLWLSAALATFTAQRIRPGAGFRRRLMLLALHLVAWILWLWFQPVDWLALLAGRS